jgi:acyl-coenzyme A synthetase/AMP-(fatty) acid ligase
MIEYVVPRPLGVDVNAIPLGRPGCAHEIRLCDEAGREVGPGEIGEICAVGPAITIGYWNDPALSAAKRLAGVPDSYRTGDLARRSDDGLITLVGRKDHMVKLRGHRFDLGEIEAAAKVVPGVREAVAFTIGAATQAVTIVLAALANVTGDERIDFERELQRVSRERLPRYARPHRIVICGEFPLLSTGKIDRRALEKIVAPD